MENNKVIIRRKDNDLHAQWSINNDDDYSTILFENTDEANEFIEAHYYFFEGVDYEIIPQPEKDGLTFIDYINYKDIVNTDDYKESCIYKA